MENKKLSLSRFASHQSMFGSFNVDSDIARWVKSVVIGPQLAIVFLCAFLFACTSNKEHPLDEQDVVTIDLSNVKVSKEPLKLSEFVESISYIRIDDTPLIPDLIFTGIAVSDDAIYIDQKFIYKYTLDGKFLKSLFKKGQGPGEAQKVTTKAAYDFQRNIVAVNNNVGNTYRLYTLDGEHIGDVSKFDASGWYKHIISYIDGNEVYCSTLAYHPLRRDTVNCDGPNFIYMRDTKADTVIYQQKNYNYGIKAVVQNAMVKDGGYPLCYGTNDGVFWWKHQSVDTIYRTTDFKDVRPWYVLKKNKSFADYEFCVHRMVLDIPEYELSRKLISTVYPLENGVLYNVAGNMDDSGIGFCKNNSKSLTFSSSGFINDVDEYFKYWKSYYVLDGRGWVKDGYLYTLVNASDFFEEGCKSPFSDLTEESNPVIVKLKLKK